MPAFRSNCLIWALGQWMREGGYIAIRKSHWGPAPHFLWSKDLRKWEGFVPVKPKRGLVVLLDKLWFLGTVIEETHQTEIVRV